MLKLVSKSTEPRVAATSWALRPPPSPEGRRRIGAPVDQSGQAGSEPIEAPLPG